MFSQEEKKLIAAAVEKVLLDLKHPELPIEKPAFKLFVSGKEEWSYAEIKPNWVFEDALEIPGVNLWNEVARGVLGNTCAKDDIKPGGTD